jgi:hypothetical protein
LVLGDSYVWGFGVDQDEIFTTRMEKLCPGLEVINMGVSGYSTDQELLLFRDKAPVYDPDVVVLVIAENDYESNAQNRKYVYYYKPVFQIERGEIVLTNHPVPRANILIRTAAAVAKRSYVLTQINRVIERLPMLLARQGVLGQVEGERAVSATNEASPPFPRSTGERLTVMLTQKLIDAVRARGARMVVAFADGLRGPLLREALPRPDAIFVKLNDFFDPRDDERLHIPKDFHWSALGHEQVAEVIAEEMVRSEIVSEAACLPPSGKHSASRAPLWY